MTTIVRAAHQDDIDALVESVAALFREDAGQHDSMMDLQWPGREGAAYYSPMLADDHCLLVLARDGDEIAGHLVGKLVGPDSLRTGCAAVLESLRVDPAARGRGVGAALVQHFLSWARGCGAQQASVTAYAANSGAQRLYERHGLVPSSITSRVVL
jgi:GNAT superfamily N-acetyltransferase